MMDESQVREIVGKSLYWMRSALRLSAWEITTDYGPVEDGIAQCEPMPERLKARIVVDPSSHDDEEKVLKSLLHEMLHVLHASLETYRKQVSALVTEQEFQALEVSWVLGCEGLVARLERAFEMGLGLSPEKLIAMAKEKSRADGWVDPEAMEAADSCR